MPSTRVAGSHGFGVEFSPFLSRYLACAASENYGVRGTGSLFVLEKSDRHEHLELRKSSKWSSGLLDVSWLRNNENFLVTCSCDGSLQLWQLFGDHASRPVTIFNEHKLDVSSVDAGPELVASGSWDSTIKLWDLCHVSSVATLKSGGGIVHSVRWSPAFPSLVVSAADGYHLAVWDRNCLTFPVNRVEAERFQSLDCAWSFFKPHSIAVAGSDGRVRLWDIRRLKYPQAAMRGGGKAVSRVKWSPHYPEIFAAATYDLSTELWDAGRGELLETVRHHSGFVLGLDFNRFVPGEVADCGMDSLIHVFHPWSLLEFNHKPLLRNKL